MMESTTAYAYAGNDKQKSDINTPLVYAVHVESQPVNYEVGVTFEEHNSRIYQLIPADIAHSPHDILLTYTNPLFIDYRRHALFISRRPSKMAFNSCLILTNQSGTSTSVLAAATVSPTVVWPGFALASLSVRYV